LRYVDVILFLLFYFYYFIINKVYEIIQEVKTRTINNFHICRFLWVFCTSLAGYTTSILTLKLLSDSHSIEIQCASYCVLRLKSVKPQKISVFGWFCWSAQTMNSFRFNEIPWNLVCVNRTLGGLSQLKLPSLVFRQKKCFFFYWFVPSVV